MADVIIALGATALATFAPLYLGLLVPSLVGKGSSGSSFFVAASAGIIFWFFLDLMGDAALLDVNLGFGGDYTHAVLAGAFAFGLLLLFGLDRRSTTPAAWGAMTGNAPTFAITLIAALAIGFHSLGEGLGVGSVVPPSASILDAIGGLGPGVAYVLHKFLEGLVVGTFGMLARIRFSQMGLVIIVAGVPTLVGFVIGLGSVLDSTYFFAMGGAGAVYLEYKLIPRIFEGEAKFSGVIYTLVGFYSMYLAGLFHG